MKWPNVQDEYETLSEILSGKSIARFGDGEFNLINGGHCKTQRYNKEISERLREVLRKPGKCLIGIPRMIGPKLEFWSKFNQPDLMKLFPLETYSAFITRPDSVPWIDHPFYWNKIESLWFGREVALVRGSEKSLTRDMLHTAACVHEIIVPHKEAWSAYNGILKTIIEMDVYRVILCAGPTATVLAHDLANRDFHAIDLGHIGMFLRKHYNGEKMVVTEKDKAFDRR